jgi:hypothetical protein
MGRCSAALLGSALSHLQPEIVIYLLRTAGHPEFVLLRLRPWMSPSSPPMAPQKSSRLHMQPGQVARTFRATPAIAIC